MAAGVTKDELRSEISDLKKQLEDMNDEENRSEPFPEEQKNEWNRVNTLLEEKQATLDEFERRDQRILELSGRSEHTEQAVESFQTRRPRAVTGDDIYDLTTVTRSYDDPQVEGGELRDRSLRSVEAARFPHIRANREDNQGHLERLVDTVNDEQGTFSRYLLMTGSPQYRRAFTKYLGGQPRTPAEDTLLLRAASLTGASGGVAVPYVLDPTVLLTGSGGINPYRQIASVETITVDEWRGVTSAGITTAFDAEAAASTDVAPTLASVVVSTEKAFAFVPYSIEIGQDWSSFAGDMAAMIQDSKDVLEAGKFATGSGTNEPFGIVTGATTVYTASNTSSLVVADVYGVHNALPSRFRSRAVWTLNNATADRIRQLDTAGGANLWVQNLQLASSSMSGSQTEGRMGADLLGHPVYEASGQSGTFTTGQLVGVIGDYGRYFKIIDRVGLTIENIPHLLGTASGQLPTGQRGLYAYWRVGSKCLSAAAFRTLKLA